MIEKIRPIAKAEHNEGIDGWDAHYEVVYYCPTCKRKIGHYHAETACDQCGTFYDWSKKANIKVTYTAEYEV